jgi:hypothetical protein
VDCLRGSRRPARGLPRHRRCVRPQIPGLSPGWSGASPYVLRVPLAGFPPVSRLPAEVRPRRPPSDGFPSSGVVRWSLRPLPGSGSPPVSLRVPFPLGNPHVSAAAGRVRRRWSRPAGTKVSSCLGPLAGVAAIRLRCRWAAAGHEGCRRRIACYERPRAHDTLRRPVAIAERDRNAGLPSSLPIIFVAVCVEIPGPTRADHLFGTRSWPRMVFLTCSPGRLVCTWPAPWIARDRWLSGCGGRHCPSGLVQVCCDLTSASRAFRNRRSGPVPARAAASS